MSQILIAHCFQTRLPNTTDTDSLPEPSRVSRRFDEHNLIAPATISQTSVSIPEFVHHSPAGSALYPVEPYRQLTVQVSHEIPVLRRAVFEADHDVIVIGEESPRL